MARWLPLALLLLASAAHAQTGPAPAFPHADGTDCSPGNFPRGVDEEGNAELCTAISAVGGAIVVEEGDVVKEALATGIDFLANDFDVTSSPAGEANIAVAAGTGTGLICRQNDTILTGSTTFSELLSAASDPADTGVFRLGNAEALCWETDPAGSDVCITVDSDGRLQLSGGPKGDFTLTDTDTGSGPGPIIRIVRNSASPAAGDQLGRINFDSAGGQTYARLDATIIDPTGGSEDGSFDIITVVNGAIADRFHFAQGMYADGVTGGDKGLGTINAKAVYDDGAQLATLDSPTFTTKITLPASGSTVAAAEGELAVKTDHWSTDHDAVEFWTGLRREYLVSTSDTCAAGENNRGAVVCSEAGTFSMQPAAMSNQNNFFQQFQCASSDGSTCKPAGTGWELAVIGTLRLDGWIAFDTWQEPVGGDPFLTFGDWATEYYEFRSDGTGAGDGTVTLDGGISMDELPDHPPLITDNGVVWVRDDGKLVYTDKAAVDLVLGAGGDTDTGPIPDCTSTELQGADGTCITDLAELNTALGTGLVTGAHVATGITDGIIVEADLDNDTSPNDEDILVYEATGTKFDWIAGKRLLGTLLESQTNNISTSHVGDDILMEKIGEEDFEFNFSNTNRINIRSNTGVNIWDFNALDVQTDGFMTHGLKVIVVPVSGTKNVGSTTRAMHMYFTTETAGNKLTFAITGGSIDAGDYFCVHDTDSSGDLGLRPEASDKIVLPSGLVLATGNEADAEVTGLPTRFCVLGLDDTLMYIQESEGINWSDGGPP